ncbi:putative multiple sugar transport system substrate-binding protein [Butyrivibrio sp. ob235]|uniref:multiple monosaccharide ABC transporter substrate-binding protein n=1 Tax=Butyrivibrio sp. ob235 TaxID=1761780 RepID=UPI0008B010E8|nr:multiple monosaccharide ABC transporter substrate-binding protein [Butyrivibrio sp. ob235]SEL61462.1 putative multiple sugar transport system substrate-binding protein [Butyrivibrio sp. ob235]
MKRKLVSTFLSVAMAASLLVGCGGGNTSAPATTDTATETEAPAAEETTEAEAPAEEATEEAAADTTAAGGGKVGVAMPTKDLQRWNQDGANMEAQLKDAGYEVDLQYASNDIATQVSQIENMISSGAQVLVIASIDGDSLGTVLAQAKEANIPVIAYDRLIMNSDAVSYYATFDNYMVGTKQGEYIRDQLDLENADGPFNLEIFTGDPGDNNAKFFYNGAVDVLKPFIDEGKLVVKSGQVDFDNVATANWATETAQSRMDAIISANYADGTKLDAVLCSNDSTALGVTNSLEANYTGDWPIITGQDCDVANVKNMIAGKQSMSIFKDTRDLAAKTVEMVDAIMKGTEAPVNDTKTYDNGTGVIPSYLCEPVFADVNNYKELLIDSGYYTEDDLK